MVQGQRHLRRLLQRRGESLREQVARVELELAPLEDAVAARAAVDLQRPLAPQGGRRHLRQRPALEQPRDADERARELGGAEPAVAVEVAQPPDALEELQRLRARDVARLGHRLGGGAATCTAVRLGGAGLGGAAVLGAAKGRCERRLLRGGRRPEGLAVGRLLRPRHPCRPGRLRRLRSGSEHRGQGRLGLGLSWPLAVVEAHPGEVQGTGRLALAVALRILAKRAALLPPERVGGPEALPPAALVRLATEGHAREGLAEWVGQRQPCRPVDARVPGYTPTCGGAGLRTERQGGSPVDAVRSRPHDRQIPVTLRLQAGGQGVRQRNALQPA
eukprot:scaffold78772_cov54-Phaeocystis_antarctica.AAC.1